MEAARPIDDRSGIVTDESDRPDRRSGSLTAQSDDEHQSVAFGMGRRAIHTQAGDDSRHARSRAIAVWGSTIAYSPPFPTALIVSRFLVLRGASYGRYQVSEHANPRVLLCVSEELDVKRSYVCPLSDDTLLVTAFRIVHENVASGG
jgi:hypothetical protein